VVSTDAQAFQVGSFVSPLTAATTNPLLQDADPALNAALSFYQAVISIHLGARFDAEMTKAGLAQYVGQISAEIVPYDPLPYLQQAGLAPPLLALYTVSEKILERTRAYYQVEADWKLLWIMPPLNAAQFEQLNGFLRAVSKVITDRTILGYDPSYQSGALFCEVGGIEQLDLGPVRYGAIQGLQTNLFFPTIEFEMTAYERRMSTPGLLTLAGTDTTIQVTDDTGANPITVVQTQT
jgi:hypothetical protein